jgi:hypothetical protein
MREGISSVRRAVVSIVSGDFPVEEYILNPRPLSDVVLDHITPTYTFAINDNSDMRHIAGSFRAVRGYQIAMLKWIVCSSNSAPIRELHAKYHASGGKAGSRAGRGDP